MKETKDKSDIKELKKYIKEAKAELKQYEVKQNNIKIYSDLLKVVTNVNDIKDLKKLMNKTKKEFKTTPATKRIKNEYKPAKITIQQKERILKANIKKAINGVFQDITIEDDFNYVKKVKEVGIEIFNNSANNIVKPIKPNFNEGQLNLINTIQTQLKRLYTNNTQYSLLSNIVIKFQIYKLDKDTIDEDGRYVPEKRDAYYNSKVSEKLTSINQINQWSEYEVSKFDAHLDAYTQEGSGWIFDKIISLKIQVSKTKKKTAGSYIKTPKILDNKKCIQNIKNDDDKCLEWCLTSFLFKDKIKCKSTADTKPLLKYIDEIKKPKDQTYPIDILKDIPK